MIEIYTDVIMWACIVFLMFWQYETERRLPSLKDYHKNEREVVYEKNIFE